MALSAGTAFIDVKPKVGPGFGKTLQSGIGGALGGVGKLAATAGLGIAAGLGAGAVASVASFADLEKGMNEVFTLLPGISQDAMGELTDDVKTFAKDFGVLPNDVVPALYQALSAGVPKDNVFEFLEVGQKAALGGVTDLNTAVDGISSVVNAYGDDVIGAAEASDLMFTAVRLGKTNFEELSASLFNVVPTASALGVGFEDVTAALAAMTAQGVPTSVATTQLRQLFVELSKEGTKTSEIFEEAAGQSFADFIAAGGNTAEALEVLVGASEDTGVALQDMFGSVEAGSAALSLTGSDAFVDSLEAMGESAGSTDAAFEQMDQGLSRTWDRIKATFATTLADIGERLAPFVQKVLDFFSEALPAAIDTLDAILGPILDVVGEVFGVLTELFGGFGGEVEGLGDTIGGVVEPFVTAFTFVKDVVTDVIGVVVGVLERNRDKIQAIFQKVGEVFQQIAEVAQVIFGALQAFWDQWGGVITEIFSTVFSNVINVLSGAFDVIKGIFDVVLGILTGDWSRAWNGIKGIFEGIWNTIKGIIENAADFLINIWHHLFGNGVIPDTIRAGLDRILGFFAELPGKIFGFIGDLPGKFVALAGDIVSGLVNGLGNIASAVGSKIKSGISSAISGVKSFFGIGSPSKVFAEVIGAPLSEGIAAGIANAASDITGELTGAITGAQTAAMRSADTADLELLNFGTTADVLDRLRSSSPTSTIAAGGNPTTTAGAAPAGTVIELHDGAIQINNPEPEPASTEIPRTMRRLERRFGRG